MPARNTIKEYAAEHYYHIYNRGVSKQKIFHEEKDYQYFLYLLKRHLSPEPVPDKYGRDYVHLYDSVKLVSYCLMPNHFHILIFNNEQDGMELLMRSVITAYSMYYNKKYDHPGRLFQGAYKASLIESEQYLQHISRYIHLIPKNYKDYPYSSYKPLIKNWDMPWLSNMLFKDVFEGTVKDYEDFVADHEDYKETLQEIGLDLADS